MLQFQHIINNKNIFHTSPYMTNKAKFDNDAIILKKHEYYMNLLTITS